MITKGIKEKAINIILSKAFLLASIGTVLKILHRKFGGHASGGRYSDSHTWTEMMQFIPEFIGIFVGVFCIVAIYESLAEKKANSNKNA